MFSVLDQCLNYRLLGFRLSERRSQMDIVHVVVDKVIQVFKVFDSLLDFRTLLFIVPMFFYYSS